MILQLTTEEMHESLDYWIPKLGLQPWRITLVRTIGADLGDKLAKVSWVLSRRIAQIQFLKEGTGESGLMADEVRDDEETIVHELLHLVFCGAHESMDDVPALGDDLVMEQPIEHLARLLVSYRRASGEALSFDARRQSNPVVWR